MKVLEDIVTQTRQIVAERKRRTTIAELQNVSRTKPRAFAQALAARPTGLIFECKRASPSQGMIRPDYDPAAIATDYKDVATCISVLTAEPFFHGSLHHLKAVRGAVDLPLLCKDFMVDPYQIYEARAHGADAILLICALLSDTELREFGQLAHTLGMDALVEVHDGAELDRALSSDAKLVGINNRNLKTMQISLEVCEELAPRVPADVTLIAESGISGRQDVQRLQKKVDGFLIGTHLMKRDDIAVAARELAYGRVKVCGLTRSVDALAAWRAGATFGGLIFARESPRAVSPREARNLVSSAPLSWVGVFVNEHTERIVQLAKDLNLAAVQLHGEEGAEQLATLRELLPAHCEIWKAQSVKDGQIPPALPGADRTLLDTYHVGIRGGSGSAFDWHSLEDHPGREQLIIAGGLDPHNARAADALGVWALDASSRLESAPGVKDHEKLAAFFGALRGRSERDQIGRDAS
ncbi:MAG: bifunctional indole-3-glycerol-phosphate synthase TrpC/phosphoribosylanthranilate isomerase TrpF [Deltaproteobacteria bacterium]|nr:bifunctional indole-3-glycerol-phosphate synthase TrpC/phosphoribosylanthranilate isomerase TrpF [Deltaproteobacteria bacterium]